VVHRNMNAKVVILVAVFSQLISYSNPCFAQNATVHGKIVDAVTGEALIGASVFAEGTTIGAMANLDGNYSFKLPPGTYTIKCRYVSFQDKSVINVKLASGEVKQVDFVLSSSENSLKEVIIEAAQIRNTDASLITLQRQSVAIQDGISTQQITRSGATNAAESMRQMTGANVQDGKYLVMRGLGDRYSISQLNGLPMASPDPYRNSSSLDLIPSSFIENIITLKSFTPDMPGNFTGGNVDISTKTFPETFTVNYATVVGYNTISNLQDDFLTSDGDRKEVFGFYGKKRAMPSQFLNDDFRNSMTPGKYIEARNPNKPDQVRTDFNNGSRAFNNDFIPDRSRSALDQRHEFSMGGKFKVFGVEVGAIGGIRYSLTHQQYNDGIVNTYVNNVQPVLFGYQQLKDHKSVINPQSGAFGNLSLKLHQNHQLILTGIYSNDAESVGRQQEGKFVGQVSNSLATFHTNSIQFTQRELYSLQVSGKHLFPKLGKAELSWTGSTNRSKQDEPDLRYFAYTSVEDYFDREDENGNPVSIFTTEYYLNNAEYARPYHFFRYLNDRQVQGRIDLKIPLSDKNENIIKVGGYYNELNRDFKEYRYELSDNGIPTDLRFTQQLMKNQGDLGAVFADKNFGIIDTQYNTAGDVFRYTTGYYYVNQSLKRNFYTGKQVIGAAYAMTVLEITKRIKFVGGVRIESTNIDVASEDTAKVTIGGKLVDPRGLINLVDVLPSGSLIVKLGEKSNLRAGASQTVARPNLREIAPFVQFDNKNGFFTLGNPTLKRTLIQNFDLRYEVFPKAGELIAVSAYAKIFENPIVQAFNNTTIPELIFINVPNARVFGVELEVRKKLDFIMPKLTNFQFAGNVSFITSRVDMPADELKTSQLFDPTFTQTSRPFAGQSPYIINLILSYINQDKGTEATITYNVSGQKLYQIALVATPDIYERPIPLLNFKFQQRFMKRFNASLNIQNMLGSKLERIQTFKGNEYIAESYRFGTLFRVGIGYTFK
jgi:TonB-dependent receptor